MRQKSMGAKEPAEQVVRNIRRRTRKQYSAEEKIRIVLSGLRGEKGIEADRCQDRVPAVNVRGAVFGERGTRMPSSDCTT